MPSAEPKPAIPRGTLLNYLVALASIVALWLAYRQVRLGEKLVRIGQEQVDISKQQVAVKRKDLRMTASAA